MNDDFGVTEMSTRYIAIGGKVEPAIVRPWWINEECAERWNNDEEFTPSDAATYKYLISCDDSFVKYSDLLAEGLKPENARGVLPLDTITQVVYTAPIRVWRHIIDLRYFGTTGKPHENARIVIGMVKDKLEELGYSFNSI